MYIRAVTQSALLTLVAGIFLFAQAQTASPLLDISASAARRGASGSFLITLKPAPGTGIVALQWEMSLGPEVTVARGDISAGSAAESSQKFLTCAPRQRNYVCILAGGQKVVSAGAIAVVRYQVSAKAHPGVATVRVENAVGTAADSKEIRIAKADAHITVE
jgi:hypothetical protein